MIDRDRPAFAALLTDALAFYGKDASPFALDVWWQACKAFPLDVVRQAISRHAMDAERGRFAPLPADVIAQIEGRTAHDGRPGPEEAWAKSLRASDEAATVVWTAEMAQAWQACKPVFDLGDKVGARMAFREAYERLVRQARQASIPAQWMASLGWDASGREAALREAVDAGCLPASELAALPAPAADVALLAAPGSTPQAGGIPEHIREQLRALRQRLTADEPVGPSKDALARAETARRKAAAQEATRRYLEGCGQSAEAAA